MKISKLAARVALALGVFAMGTGLALAGGDPVPDVEVVVAMLPSGTIKVGDCQAAGGRIEKMDGKWTCVGMPNTRTVNITRSNIKHPNLGKTPQPSDGN